MFLAGVCESTKEGKGSWATFREEEERSESPSFLPEIGCSPGPCSALCARLFFRRTGAVSGLPDLCNFNSMLQNLSALAKSF